MALQGVGAVGRHALPYLLKAGAVVTIADIDQERARQIATEYTIGIAHPEEIHALNVDVYCPCALGGTLNDQSLLELQCKIVCGSANNQLVDDRHGDVLRQRGILYAPDYIVNAGGLLSGLDSLRPGGFDRQRALERVARIYETMEHVIALARERNVPTYRAADLLAEQHIAMMRQIKTLAKGI